MIGSGSSRISGSSSSILWSLRPLHACSSRSSSRKGNYRERSLEKTSNIMNVIKLFETWHHHLLAQSHPNLPVAARRRLPCILPWLPLECRERKACRMHHKRKALSQNLTGLKFDLPSPSIPAPPASHPPITDHGSGITIYGSRTRDHGHRHGSTRAYAYVLEYYSI